MLQSVTDHESVSGKPAVLQPGVLTLVGTPIGNLDDLSLRAAAALSEADLIAAEDTRRTRQLLNHLGIRKKLISYHQHNLRQRQSYLIDQLKAGYRLVLVSDAGMPGISDPGSELAAACLDEDIPVSAIPGPTALITALVVSGLDTNRFAFDGFLPVSGQKRKNAVRDLQRETRTILLYEAPHRLRQTLKDLFANGLGERRIAVVRELTKRFETILRMTVEEAHQTIQDDMIRGEYVLVLEGLDAYESRVPQTDRTDDEPDRDLELIQSMLQENRSVRDIVRIIAGQSRRSRNALYQLALQTEREQKNTTNKA